jgi:hypothetical protein
VIILSGFTVVDEKLSLEFLEQERSSTNEKNRTAEFS